MAHTAEAFLFALSAYVLHRDGTSTTTNGSSSSSSSKACPLCGTSFSLLFRRHHCRCCGGLACALCSSKKLAIAK